MTHCVCRLTQVCTRVAGLSVFLCVDYFCQLIPARESQASAAEGVVQVGYRTRLKIRGIRSGTAYIQPALDRPGLDMLINAQVAKVIQTRTQSGKPVFRGVQLVTSSSGKPHCYRRIDKSLIATPFLTRPKFALNTTQEAILCAGAV